MHKAGSGLQALGDRVILSRQSKVLAVSPSVTRKETNTSTRSIPLSLLWRASLSLEHPLSLSLLFSSPWKAESQTPKCHPAGTGREHHAQSSLALSCSAPAGFSQIRIVPDISDMGTFMGNLWWVVKMMLGFSKILYGTK